MNFSLYVNRSNICLLRDSHIVSQMYSDVIPMEYNPYIDRLQLSSCYCSCIICKQSDLYMLWVHVGIIDTLNSMVCVFWLLCFSLCHHPPHLHSPPTHPLIYADPMLMTSMKKLSKLVKITHYLLARFVIEKLMDNCALLCLVNESNIQARLIF